jgi:hypothetical protein
VRVVGAGVASSFGCATGTCAGGRRPRLVLGRARARLARWPGLVVGPGLAFGFACVLGVVDWDG